MAEKITFAGERFDLDFDFRGLDRRIIHMDEDIILICKLNTHSDEVRKEILNRLNLLYVDESLDVRIENQTFCKFMRDFFISACASSEKSDLTDSLVKIRMGDGEEELNDNKETK